MAKRGGKAKGKAGRGKSKGSSKAGDKVNPRTGRRTKYLGHRVPDVRGAGLDSPSEFRRIKQEILEDYREGRIRKNTARGRLLLLLRLTYVKHNRNARNISPDTRRELRKEIREAMSQLASKKRKGRRK